MMPKMDRYNNPIGTGQPVTIGLIIILCGGLLSTIWIASGLVTKIDTRLYSIETVLNTMQASSKISMEQLIQFEKRLTRIETIESPAVQQIQKDLSELVRRIEIHMAKDTKP